MSPGEMIAAIKHAIVGLSEWLRHGLDHVAPEVGPTIVAKWRRTTGAS